MTALQRHFGWWEQNPRVRSCVGRGEDETDRGEVTGEKAAAEPHGGPSRSTCNIRCRARTPPDAAAGTPGPERCCCGVRSLARRPLKQSLVFRMFIRASRGDPHRDRKGGGKARGPTKLTLWSTGAEMARKPGGVSCLGLYLSTASCHCPWAIPGTGVSWGQAALRQQGDPWSG